MTQSRNGFNFDIDFPESQLAKLTSIPFLFRTQVVDKVLRAMAVPILSKAKAIAPDSETPIQADGRTNREKQGKNTTYNSKGHVSYSPEWQRDKAKQNLGYKFVAFEHTGVLIVGGKEKANKLNFDSGEARDVVYWGTYARKLKRVAPEDRFMHRAYEETKGEQVAYGVAKLQSELRDLT